MKKEKVSYKCEKCGYEFIKESISKFERCPKCRGYSLEIGYNPKEKRTTWRIT